VPGHGSDKCLEYLRNNKDGGQKNWSFAMALDEIIAFVNNEEECPLACLEVMGYGRKADANGISRVYNKLNGTWFDQKHAEHWMCKLYIQAKYTGPNYLKTKQPDASSPHCHPQRFRQEDCNEVGREKILLKQMMEETCEKYEHLATNGDKTERDLCSPPVIVIIPKENIVPFGPTLGTSCAI
jgi:hypothetical protein